MLLNIFSAISAEFIRIVTGRLFTDAQIKQVAGHAVGKYFANLLPEPADERAARQRVEEARAHISKASEIIAQLQTELVAQTEQLDLVLLEIEEKKKLAERYEALTKIGQDQFAAYKSVIEDSIRRELVFQLERGKTPRRLASAFIWLVTLLLGAALGTYFKEMVAWVMKLFS